MARHFGRTWWGKAWVDAVENRAKLDPNRLPRGRTYARNGSVLSVECVEGSIRGSVQGSRLHPYRVDVRFRTFTDQEWARLLAVIVSRVGQTAALLDGDLHPDLVEQAATAGLQLLPDAGELQPRCSCPDRADPCKHSAAVCYLVADELDADPFALMLLRGRTRDQILTKVRSLRSERSGRSNGDGSASLRPTANGAGSRGARAGGGDALKTDRGVRATEAWARPLGSLPSIPTPRLHPGRPAAIAVDPPDEAQFTIEGLDALIADAAVRAWSTVTGRPALHLELTAKEDLIRRAANAIGTAQLQHLAKEANTTPRALTRRAIAWRVGAAAGLAAIDEPAWPALPLAMAAAHQAVVENTPASSPVKVDRNRVTTDVRQFRLSRRGHWWRFIKRGSAWELDAGPAADLDELL